MTAIPDSTTQWAELTPLVNRLDELKAAVERTEGITLSDQKFANRFLAFSATTWSKIKSATYAGSLPSVGEKCRAAIESIEAQLPALAETARFSQSFIRTQFAKAAFSAVNLAKAGKEDRRVVVLLAPTGYGKTAIANYLRTKGAVTVEGRQAWRTSYKAFCLDIVSALGRSIPPSWQESRCERDMIDALSSKAGLLFIDEANTMSAACANAIKHIVNKTAYTVVVAAIPEMWDKFLAGNRGEVLQLLNRCQPVIRASRVEETDVAQFLASRSLPVASPFPRDIARAANAFGGFRTVVALVNRLAEIGSPTPDDLAKELKIHAENLASSGLGKQPL